MKERGLCPIRIAIVILIVIIIIGSIFSWQNGFSFSFSQMAPLSDGAARLSGQSQLQPLRGTSLLQRTNSQNDDLIWAASLYTNEMKAYINQMVDRITNESKSGSGHSHSLSSDPLVYQKERLDQATMRYVSTLVLHQQRLQLRQFQFNVRVSELDNVPKNLFPKETLDLASAYIERNQALLDLIQYSLLPKKYCRNTPSSSQAKTNKDIVLGLELDKEHSNDQNQNEEMIDEYTRSLEHNLKTKTSILTSPLQTREDTEDDRKFSELFNFACLGYAKALWDGDLIKANRIFDYATSVSRSII